MRKLDDIAVRVLTVQIGLGAVATLASLLSSSSVNGWNTVIAVNVLVMVVILVGRLVVRSVVKPGKSL